MMMKKLTSIRPTRLVSFPRRRESKIGNYWIPDQVGNDNMGGSRKSQSKLYAGFTLIELLVVISIIGLLSSIVLTSVNSARAKARDARRIADLKQIQTALEFYYDTNGQYPLGSQGSGVWSAACPSYGGRPTDYILGLAPTYIPVLPLDPRPINPSGGCYLYNSNGTDYSFLVHRTMETIVGGDPSAAGNPPHIQALDRPCCVQPTISVSSPGGRNW
ncbi:MAG: prepilin-type N-terminal cleavage/methylation domain-containing protein [Candidatus Sungiibacteriota bacterium]